MKLRYAALISVMFAGLILSGCIEEKIKPEKTKFQEYSDIPVRNKVPGGKIIEVNQHYDLILVYESGIGRRSITGLGINNTNLYFSFVENGENKFLVFSNKKLNATLGTHYFYIPYGKSYIERYSKQEFPGWNLKIVLFEIGNKTKYYGRKNITYYYWGINITYLMLLQDEEEIKRMISRYRGRSLVSLNLSSHMVSSGHSHYNDAFIELEGEQIFVNESNRPEYEPPRFTLKTYRINKTALLNEVIDILLRLNYTNENYGRVDSVLSDFPVGFDQIINEDISMEFKDGTTLRVSYSHQSAFLLGKIEINGNTFLLSYYDHFDGPPAGRLFYNAVMKSVVD